MQRYMTECLDVCTNKAYLTGLTSKMTRKNSVYVHFMKYHLLAFYMAGVRPMISLCITAIYWCGDIRTHQVDNF